MTRLELIDKLEKEIKAAEYLSLLNGRKEGTMVISLSGAKQILEYLKVPSYVKKSISHAIIKL